jgi:cardiolipin synthase C
MQITMPGNPAQSRLTGHHTLPFTLLVLAFLGGCASLPPGSNYPKTPSTAFGEPQTTLFGKQFAAESSRNGGRPGFRIFNVGVDGLLIRVEMINAAERSLDLQYYIFRGDESGRLVTDALVRAADRGVRVRVLVDDGETVAGDEQLLALSGHPAVEIRVFNPWKYRGHNDLLRGAEFLLRHSRLDYRMHNKMMIADSAVALTGGRNIGDQYFQIDPESQFADDDVFVAGPLIHEMSSKFDEYWNSALAIPAEALTHRDPKDLAASSSRLLAAARARKVAAAGLSYEQKLASGEPLSGILSGKLPLTWADGQFVCDPPDKKAAMARVRVGDLSYQPLRQLATQAQTELIIVSPYFVPTKDELHLLESRSQQQARVRVLTNSLESNPNPVAHAGYMHYRAKLLQDGVQINEVRARLGDTRGSGESKRLARYGNYALHAKVYVFDRKDLVIGSLNFDVRSRRLNTEMGLIIVNGDLSEQEARRFDLMTRPENSYVVALRSVSGRGRPRLVWRSIENGKPVEYDSEPARSFWQKAQVTILSWLPIDSEL